MRAIQTSQFLHLAMMAVVATAWFGFAEAFLPITTSPQGGVSTTNPSHPLAFGRPSLKMVVSSMGRFHNCSTDADGVAEPMEEATTNTQRKGGYQPIEEWDEEREANGGAWGDKVKFDGQRFGNQVRQNEILQKHLGGFK